MPRNFTEPHASKSYGATCLEVLRSYIHELNRETFQSFPHWHPPGWQGGGLGALGQHQHPELCPEFEFGVVRESSAFTRDSAEVLHCPPAAALRHGRASMT
jgi:hypothetical protein